MARIFPVAYQCLVCVFQKEGFTYRRTKGDHLIYTRFSTVRPLVIPMYDQVPIFIIQNLLRTAQISRERYFTLLKEC